MRERLEGRESFVPSELRSKSVLRTFARMIGIKTPEILFRGSVENLVTAALEGEFVIKPEFASTSIGVMLLRRRDDGFFDDLLGGDALSIEEISSRCREIALRYFDDLSKGIFLVEELLRDHDGGTPPQDVRFYAFQGEVGMILKEAHLTSGAARAMYFDGDFLPFPDVVARYSVAPGAEQLEEIVEAVVPENWAELLAVAKRISAAVPAAFCRVDLYDTPQGVYLGEITFFPGTFYYRDRKIMSSSEAARLGRLWGEAYSRLAGSAPGVRYRPSVQDLGVPSSPGL